MVSLSIEFNHQQVKLKAPISIARNVILQPEYRSSNAFFLPSLATTTFEFEDQFIGDIERGGSCNVDIHHYTPHNLTHIETSAHIVKNGITLLNLDRVVLSGILQVIDISHLTLKPGDVIKYSHIKDKLEDLSKEVSIVAIKSQYSKIDQATDFSNKNPISIDPLLCKHFYEHFPKIKGLIVDLPSVDNEQDSKLLAHRHFFGLPDTGIISENLEHRFLVELAFFNDVEPGYYYCILTPPRIETNAAITDILVYPLNAD